MKNIICIILLICSSNIFAQTNIENDDLYLKYEKAYTDYVNSRNILELKNLDKMEGDFYKSFKDSKALKSYRKSKDPLKWLEKNHAKTNFSNVMEAQNAYNSIELIKNKNANDASLYIKYLDDLLKKYDKNLIWKTYTTRLQNKKEEL